MLLIGLLVCVVVQCRGAQAQQTSSVTLDEIIRAWREREQATRTLEYEWTETELVPKEMLSCPTPSGKMVRYPAQDMTIRTTCRLKIDGQKMRYEREGLHFIQRLGEYAPRLYVSVKDGEAARCLFSRDASSEDRFPGTGFISRDDEGGTDATTGTVLAVMMCYRPFSMHQGSQYDVSKCRITPGVAVLGDRRCLVLEQVKDGPIKGDRLFKSLFWVDERGPHEPMRRQDVVAGEARSQLDVEYATEPGSGRFVSGWRFVAYTQSAPPGAGGLLQMQYEARVTSHRFNVPIPESQFVFGEFPPGTWVVDNRSQDRYIVRPDGSIRPITKAETAVGYTYEQLLNSEPMFLDKPRPLWRRWEWIAGATLVIVLLAWRLLRRNRRRTSAVPFLLAGVTALLVQCDGACAQAPSTVTLEQIVRAWREREQATRTLEYEWIETDLVVAGRDSYYKPGGQQVVFPSHDLTVATTCRLKIDGQKMRYERDGPQFVYEIGEYARRSYVSVKDGKSMKGLFHKDPSGQDRFPANSFTREDNASFSDADSLPLLPVMMCYRPFSMHQGRHYDVSKSHITPGVGVVGEHRCVVLEQFIDLAVKGDRLQKNLFWVRQEPPHEPTRLQIIMGGEARGELDLEYAEEPGSGRFLSGWRHVAYSQGVPPGPGRRLQLQSEGRVTSHKFNVAIPDAAFVLEDPPPGALVLDRRSDEQYIVREDGSKRPITQAERAAGYTYEQLVKTEPLFLHKPRPLWRRWEWIGVASLVILLLVWRRLRRQRRGREVA